MTLRPCVVCGEPTGSTRCSAHTVSRRKTNASARGYDTAWRKLSERARRLQPFCTDCGSTEDLQTDHSPQAWQRKAEGHAIRLADVEVVCGPCNRTRGAARGRTPSRTASDPRAKAKSLLLTPQGGTS